MAEEVKYDLQLVSEWAIEFNHDPPDTVKVISEEAILTHKMTEMFWRPSGSGFGCVRVADGNLVTSKLNENVLGDIAG